MVLDTSAIVATITVDVQLGRPLKPPDFRLELKAQLCGFLVGQPVRHLRKDGPIEQDRLRLPGQPLGRPGFGQNLVEFGAHRVRIGAIFGRRCILANRSDSENKFGCLARTISAGLPTNLPTT